jgi:hypothetical protein
VVDVIRRYLVFFGSLLFLLTGCTGKGAPTPVSPTPPIPPPAQSNSIVSSWTANSIVVSSADGNACGGATVVGATSRNIEWRITTEDPSILLEVDMANYPTDHMRYSGVSTGRQFAGSYATGADYLDFFCELRGGELTGTFSANGLTFEATETLIWGPPANERTVERRWSGVKR